MNINYYKWNKKDYQLFKKSTYDNLKINNIQFYQPYYSLYFHIFNTKNSHKYIDIKRRYFIKEIIEITNKKYHTSNTFLKCKIYDSIKNIYTIEEIFCKCMPLLDPLNMIMNNYNNYVQRNPLLPSCYNNNTFEKINNMNNNAYIDTFLSFICSEITLNQINPSFPIYYGSLNGLKEEYNYDISEDYDSLKNEEWFHKNVNNYNFEIDMYVSSDDSDDDGSDSDNSNSDDSDSDGSDSDGSDSDGSNSSCLSLASNSSSNISIKGQNDYIMILKDLPVQLFFIEKLQGTLEDLLCEIENINVDVILSCMFQVSFALMYLQKHYHFTHNDLHVNNIMYTTTNKTFLYYKYNNIYFKVPTFGYLFKIIDFGRAIFKFHNKLFFNDTFEKHGEAEGQYSKPFNKLNFEDKNEKKIPQNFNFDLCRLAITILDVSNYNKNKNYNKKQSFIDFIYNLTLTDTGDSLFDLEDNFNMYISIAKYSTNALPKQIIQNSIFNQYRIKKKEFPKKSFYSL